MSQLKLMINVTPYDFDRANDKLYRIDVEFIRHFLRESMINYLHGALIQYENHTSKIKFPTGELSNVIQFSSIRRKGDTYITSITVRSEHASFVEFGTGLHGELVKPHYITTKWYHSWSLGTHKKFKAMHWVTRQGQFAGEWVMKRVRGQYPKPFMRASVMRLALEEDLIDGYHITTYIIYPTKSDFRMDFYGE